MKAIIPFFLLLLFFSAYAVTFGDLEVIAKHPNETENKTLEIEDIEVAPEEEPPPEIPAEEPEMVVPEVSETDQEEPVPELYEEPDALPPVKEPDSITQENATPVVNETGEEADYPPEQESQGIGIEIFLLIGVVIIIAAYLLLQKK